MDEPALALARRSTAWEDLTRRRFDLLVIGGGIAGAAIANEAATRGLAVALVERADFGSGTTSASSKLIHGGLRYLRLGDVRLVKEAHAERRALMRVVAPHLVWRLPFLLPLYRGGPYGAATARAGLWLYSRLARERVGPSLDPAAAAERVPSLRPDGLHACGLYADAATHDTRLCLANVRAAADAGAVVLNYASAVELRLEGGRVAGAEVRDELSGGSTSVRARALVNATGPWVDGIRRLEDRSARPSGRLSKGVHVLVPLERPWSAAVTIPHEGARVSFAVPWQGMLLLGTTDTPFEGDPGEARASEEDIAAVLAQAAVALEGPFLRREAVRAAFAGLRVLPLGDGDTADARRETVFLRGSGGMLSIAGGKLTTYRRIALEALARLRSDLALRSIDPSPVPLPGAADPRDVAQRLARRAPELEPRVRTHLARLYGSLADEVVDGARGERALLAPLHPQAPDVGGQVLYAAAREWACTAEDVLVRRTSLAHRGLATPGVVARVEALLAAAPTD
ncbi:MAG: glycerol-3-phosphate dehydrogenase/oxidase [Actinomycetota bacterium]|nr:glycerol-3-phosphate dehydrogenase/oxidase [Actinomycetota bacterium]